jgi:pimeloyl-ACP methyl ester carboxylesterase
MIVALFFAVLHARARAYTDILTGIAKNYVDCTPDPRTSYWQRYCTDPLSAFINEIQFAWKNTNPCRARLITEHDIVQPQNDQDHRGLVVFVHGLNGRPGQWRTMSKTVQEQLPEFSIWTPKVHCKGNTCLDVAAGKILPTVTQYLKDYPDNGVALVGVSNGGRIVLRLSLLLPTNRHISCHSIAGVLFGSVVMAGAASIAQPLLQIQYHDKIVRQLQWNSKMCRQLLDKVVEHQNHCRGYFFHATRNDQLIGIAHSSVPKLQDAECARYEKYYYSGVGHSSIIARATPCILQDIQSFHTMS